MDRDPTTEEFGRWLRAQRLDRGVSQETVAEGAKMSLPRWRHRARRAQGARTAHIVSRSFVDRVVDRRPGPRRWADGSR